MANPEKITRDIRLDAIRGLLLVIMTIDHLPGSLSDYTYGVLGYTTAAEAFIFLSGLIAGRVYDRYTFYHDKRWLWRKAAKRALAIYGCHILTFVALLTLCMFPSGKTFLMEDSLSLCVEHPMKALCMGLALIYQPRLLDILPMYCLFILMVPVLVHCAKPKQQVVVAASSFSLWLIAQFGIREYAEKATSNSEINLGYFNILAWQIIFVLGVLAGIRISKPWSYGKAQKKILLAVIAMAAIGLFLARHHVVMPPEIYYRLDFWAGVSDLGPVRLLNFCLLAVLASYLLIWRTDTLWNKGLALLGRHSLQVFTFHVSMVYLFFGVIFHSSFKEIWVILIVMSLFIPPWLTEYLKPMLSNGNLQNKQSEVRVV